MEKCHYVYDEIAGKVLIPYCYDMLHSDDIRNCTCKSCPETFAQFQNKEYNKTVTELKRQIKWLEKEKSSLNRIIKKLLRIK